MSNDSQNGRKEQKFSIAEPHDLSPRSKWMRDYYFKGDEREWKNQYMAFTTGTDWDIIWNEIDYYVAPEVHFYIGNKGKGVFESSLRSMAVQVELPDNFWQLSLPERRMIFFEEVMINHIPHEIISENDLVAGGRFNTQLSKCLTKKEAKKHWKKNINTRQKFFKYHKSGFGNVGATGGHLIPDHETIIKYGFKYVHEMALNEYEKLSQKEKNAEKGAELRAMIKAAEIPRKLAKKYADECRNLKESASTPERVEELEQMAKNLERVPWEPAETFWQGIQALWLGFIQEGCA
ncbi:MAG: pyruvate formate lyase family protein [Promethearchaeota archaeon]